MDALAMPLGVRLLAVCVACILSNVSLLELAAQDELAGSGAEIRSTRDRVYSELAADVAELEQHGNILKRIVKLVTPAVVHIEARR
jgi:hypothetical protein